MLSESEELNELSFNRGCFAIASPAMLRILVETKATGKALLRP